MLCWYPLCIYLKTEFGKTVLICFKTSLSQPWRQALHISDLAQLFNCSIKEGEDGATVWTWSVCTNASGGRRRCFQAYYVLSLYELLKPPLKSNWVTSATAAVLGNEPDEGLQHTRKSRKCTDGCTAVLRIQANWTTRFSLLSRRQFSKDQLHLKKSTPQHSFNFSLFSKGVLGIVSITIIFRSSHWTFRRVLFSLTVALALHLSLKQLYIHC